VGLARARRRTYVGLVATPIDELDAMDGYGAVMRRATIVLTLILAAALVAVSPAAAQNVRKGPRGDAFYTPPKPLKGKHGSLIWARRQTGSDALKRNARLLLYRSKSVDGDMVAVSGSLTLPSGRKPRGGWPVVTYAPGTVGVADACAPTRGYDGNTLVSYAYPLLHRFLNAGFAVVRTDYEGLGTPGVHPFLIGRSEGRGVLDAVRAARQLEPRLSRRYVIAGHSQGGHAALFAAATARRWVPDLRLRGTVALAPASHLEEQFRLTRSLSNAGGGLGAFVALGLRAVDTVAPQLYLPELLTDRARALYPQTLRRCLDTLGAPDSFGGLPLNEILRGDAQLDPLFSFVGAQDPESLKVNSRVRILQGSADGTVFASFTSQLVSDYQTRGTKVAYTLYDGVTHAGVVEAGGADATRWIKRRLK
jgi:pimeloyl-ACP methyl ester carboxylesterase